MNIPTRLSLDSSPESDSRSLQKQKRGPPISYISTTDEEESSQHPVSSLTQRHAYGTDLRTAPTAPAVPSDVDAEDEWDYSETERWGWVILIATWMVFVVVMGSCFGVWSWAWDVGETPYAPPDLEDDDTLPITGYYPALMVCTAVMAWVWVVVAWVGMKYFRHAKVVADDG
ncbi:hypothetical protein GQ44DRAFT_766593 [Phaeosphaeriaceae sp. PMI808]|nr:hypothetical protein GQ44DRAFT_766593 [Phaeosphaeriaceae sp. PMI808]